MSRPAEKTAATVITNLVTLMSDFGVDKQSLSKKSGVSPRMVAYVLSGERMPSLDVLDKLSVVFGITGWQLTIPNIKADLIKNGRLEKLVHSYIITSEDGRQYIDRVAERESHYKRVY